MLLYQTSEGIYFQMISLSIQEIDLETPTIIDMLCGMHKNITRYCWGGCETSTAHSSRGAGCETSTPAFQNRRDCWSIGLSKCWTRLSL